MDSTVIIALSASLAAIVSAFATYVLGCRKVEAHVAEVVATAYSSLVEDLNRQISTLMARLEGVEKAEERLRVKVESLRKRIAELEKENARLSAENERLRKFGDAE